MPQTLISGTIFRRKTVATRRLSARVSVALVVLASSAFWGLLFWAVLRGP